MSLMTREDGIAGGASESAISRKLRVGITSPVTAGDESGLWLQGRGEPPRGPLAARNSVRNDRVQDASAWDWS